MSPIRRIVPDVSADDPQKVAEFYKDLFGFKVVMDGDWIVTLAAEGQSPLQLTIASQGGSGTPVPDMTIEVQDVEALYEAAHGAGHPIPYALTDEPWGVRRFYVRDPAGNVVNVMQHLDG